jgi:hypothetical protein
MAPAGDAEAAAGAPELGRGHPEDGSGGGQRQARLQREDRLQREESAAAAFDRRWFAYSPAEGKVMFMYHVATTNFFILLSWGNYGIGEMV